MTPAEIYPLPDGWHLYFQPSATSSNDLALAALKERGASAQGSCFQVGEQTKGRGRRGKHWVSRSGDGLYLSVILCPAQSRASWPGLSFMASLAVYKALLGFVDETRRHAIRLKWPNDILYDSCKLAGILLEASEDGVIVGCGINMKNPPNIHSSAFPATALDDLVASKPVDPDELAVCVIRHMAELYSIWQSAGGDSILDEWCSYCDMKGQPVRIQTLSDDVVGICDDIGRDGQLYVRKADGKIVQITAGDVEILRGQNASGD